MGRVLASGMSTAMVTLRPVDGWYRLQAGGEGENDTTPEEFVNPGPGGYADDYGGIWMRATDNRAAQVTVETWPVGSEPFRRGADVAFDGEFEVPDTGENSGAVTTILDNGVSGGMPGEPVGIQLEPGVWQVCIWQFGDHRWWVDIIDTV